MGKFKRTIYEYEDLVTSGELEVKKGVPYKETDTVRLFKGAVRAVGGGASAIKYSAYAKAKKIANAYDFVLGWDHAILLQKVNGMYEAIGIYAHGPNDENPDVCVYEVTGPGNSVKISPNGTRDMPNGTHSCGSHRGKACVWRFYDLRKKNLKVARIVTFGITSCSFACLWPVSRDYLVVSHIAFSPAIPLFWIWRTHDNHASIHSAEMLASLNSSNEEIDKFTVENLPYSSMHKVTAKILLRGPYRCRNDGGNTPFMTHPYVTLSFAGADITYAGDLGFNNDPTLPIELPPFHSVLGTAMPVFKNCADAKAILDYANDFVTGRYGFASLHNTMLALIKFLDQKAEVEDSMKPFYESNTRYQSATVDTLLKQIVSKKIVVPQTLKGRERAVFLMAELTKNPKEPKYKMAFDAVMHAWQMEQLGFSMPLRMFHRTDSGADGIPEQFEDETVTSGATELLKAMRSIQSNPMFKLAEQRFEQQGQDDDWE